MFVLQLVSAILPCLRVLWIGGQVWATKAPVSVAVPI